MKFNTDEPLLDRENEPVIEKTTNEKGEIKSKLITLGVVAIRAVDLQLPGDKDIKPEEVLANFMLTVKIANGGVIDITTEQAAMLKARVVNFNNLIAGRLMYALENGPKGE